MRKTRGVNACNQAFREEALAYLESSQRTFADVAASLGIPKHTLYTWYRSDMAAKAKKDLYRPRLAHEGIPVSMGRKGLLGQ